MSLEDNLHTAMCQAVALLNVTPEIARSETGRRAHDILREALVKHADEYILSLSRRMSAPPLPANIRRGPDDEP